MFEEEPRDRTETEQSEGNLNLSCEDPKDYKELPPEHAEED